MKVSSTKTIRFTALIQAAGQPELANLWTRPEEDKPFMKAVRQNRVLTVKQENVGSTRDFGVIGFLREKNASYMLFPKSLGAFKDRRVVGIKYELVKTAPPVGNVVKQRSPEQRTWGRGVLPAEWAQTAEPGLRPQRTHTESAHAKKDRRKQFRTIVRFVATVDVQVQLKAVNATEARQQALKEVEAPDFAKATITRKVLKTSRISSR